MRNSPRLAGIWQVDRRNSSSSQQRIRPAFQQSLFQAERLIQIIFSKVVRTDPFLFNMQNISPATL